MGILDQQTRTAIRNVILAHIKRETRRNPQLPGCPLGHFGATGPESDVVREMIADGTLTLIERPRKTDPTATAKFVTVTGA